MHAQVATGSSDELLEVLGATQSRPHNYMWLMHHFVPRKHPGSTSAANIRFLSILFVFNYENTYDREKVAFTLTFWRRLTPECESGRDFFTIMCVLPIKIGLGGVPGGRSPASKPGISISPKVCEFWRTYLMTQTPVPTPPSRAHPKDDARSSRQLPQISSSR